MATDRLGKAKDRDRGEPEVTGLQPFDGSLGALLDSWERDLVSQGKAPDTISSYLKAARQYLAWAAAEGVSDDPADHDRATIKAWAHHEMTRVSERTGRRLKAGAVAREWAHLRQFWRWLVAEGEASVNPMDGLQPPAVPDEPVPVVPDDHIVALLGTCDGRSFEGRRDEAIIRVLFDTGVRAGELCSIKVDEIDWAENVITVYGKGTGGGRPRQVPIGAKTARAIDRYLRLRARHRAASSPWLWLGTRGRGIERLGVSGLAKMLERRAREAGVPHVYPHQARHTQSHRWLDNGGSEGDLMQLNGWSSPAMLRRYGRSAAAARARRAHRELGLGDRY